MYYTICSRLRAFNAVIREDFCVLARIRFIPVNTRYISLDSTLLPEFGRTSGIVSYASTQLLKAPLNIILRAPHARDTVRQRVQFRISHFGRDSRDYGLMTLV